MYIPRIWAKASGDGKFADGRTLPVSVWGWGDDESTAREGAADRLQRVLDRIRGGKPFPGQYGYGNRPLKEEILQTIEGSTPGGPAGRDVQELMQVSGTDPDFSRLCLAQKSFRARLTPKPWRINLPGPPGTHPRHDAESRVELGAWLTKYEKASAGYATCRYLETIGTSGATGDARWLLELHDRVTRCSESLPLA